MKYVIVIPTYNERLNIEKLIKKIFATDLDIDILFVDDKSPDKTGDYIKRVQKRNTHIYLIEGDKKGLGDAYKRGFLYAIEKLHAKYIIQMDADLSHDPKYIDTLIKESKNNDVVIGSRYIDGGSIPNEWSFTRRMNSKFGNVFTKSVLKIPYNDCTSGFKIIKTSVFDKDIIRSINSNGYLFQVEILYYFYKKHLKIKEIPIEFKDRSLGASKLSLKDIFEYFSRINKIKNKYNRLYN